MLRLLKALFPCESVESAGREHRGGVKGGGVIVPVSRMFLLIKSDISKILTKYYY